MAATATTELSIAQRIYTLAEDPAKRPVIVRRNTLPTLMRLIPHKDHKVRWTAVSALQLLSSHPDNIEPCCAEKGLLQLLYNTMKDAECTDPELYEITANIFANLKSALGNSNEDASDNGAHGAAADVGGSARIARNRTARVLKGSARECRSMTLKFGGAAASRKSLKDAAGCGELEELLQTIRGVVSYSVDQSSRSATLFLSTPTATLLQVLRDEGFDDATVVGESAPQLSTSSNGGRGGGIGGIPSYLAQDNGGSSSFFGAGIDFMKSLVVSGVDSNSLAARLKKQKEEEQRKKTAAAKGHVASFIGKMTASWW